MTIPLGWQAPLAPNVGHSSGITGLDLCAPSHNPKLHLPRSSSLVRQWPKMRRVTLDAVSHSTGIAQCCCDNAYFPISPSFYHQILDTLPVGCGLDVLAHVGVQASNSYTLFGNEEGGGYDFGLTATFGNVQKAGSFSLDALPEPVISSVHGLHLWRQVSATASTTIIQTRNNFYQTAGSPTAPGASLLSSGFSPAFYWSPFEPPFDVAQTNVGPVFAPNTGTIASVTGGVGQGSVSTTNFTDLGPYDPRASGTFELTTVIASPSGYAAAWAGTGACNFSVEYVVGVIRC